MHDAVIYVTTGRDRARDAARTAARAWQGAHAAGLEACRAIRCRSPSPPHAACEALLVRASAEALAAVPAMFTVERLTLTPQRQRAAIVRDVVFEVRGRLVRGMSHFAPGALVYVAGAYSGDGFARTMMIGRDRESARYITVMGATARLKQWHLADLIDPEALFVLGHSAGNWTVEPAALAILPATPPPIAWQPAAAWSQLVARWLDPARPQLATCAATALDCPLDQAQRKLERGTLGAELVAAQQGRSQPGLPTVLRSSAAAWQALAPAAWQADPPTRVFARRDLAAPHTEWLAVPTRALPGNMHAVVCLCSDPAGVATAETFARELAAILGPPAPATLPGAPAPATLLGSPAPATPPTVIWHFVRHSEIGTLLAPPPHHRGPDPRLATERGRTIAALRALTLAIARDDDRAAHTLAAALRSSAAPDRDPTIPLLSLLACGYALLDLTDDGTPHLACPLLPTVRATASPRASA